MISPLNSNPCSITVNIPDLPRITTIELPCFVKSKECALLMLGGESQVIATLEASDTAPLNCKFPNGYHLQNSLVSSNVNCKGFAVKIVRRKSDGRVCKVEIIGLITRSISFSNPADYQVIWLLVIFITFFDLFFCFFI
jgi:predicted trehalose synthase